MSLRRLPPSILGALLVLLSVCRWPGLLPANFSPVYALAFCAGVYLQGWMSWWLPMGALLITDILLNGHYGVPVISTYMAVNYLAYAVLIALGRSFSSARSWLHLLGGGLLGALLFYLVTNTGAWFNPAPGPFPQAPYPKTLWGWLQALTVGASPWPPTWTFLRNTLLSGGLFTGLFVGIASSLPRVDSPEEASSEPFHGEPGAPEPQHEPSCLRLSATIPAPDSNPSPACAREGSVSVSCALC